MKNIAYKIKRLEKKIMQTWYFYSGFMQPNLRPISFSFNTKLEVSPIQNF